MRYIELFEQKLKEYKIEKIKKDSLTIPVIINPTKEQIISWSKNSADQILRGYYSDGDFYMWDAWYSNHDEMVPELGLEYKSSDIFYIKYIDDEDIRLNWVLYDIKIPQYVLDNSYIQSLFNNTHMPNVMSLKTE